MYTLAKAWQYYFFKYNWYSINSPGYPITLIYVLLLVTAVPGESRLTDSLLLSNPAAFDVPLLKHVTFFVG